MFEVVLDYGEHDAESPTPQDPGNRLCRPDPFSDYCAGFEIRTYRRCERALMFHHFADEPGVGRNCLVRSTDFIYRKPANTSDDSPDGLSFATFLRSVTQSAYRRQPGGYLKRSMPALDFQYTEARIHDEVKNVDTESLENLPAGLTGGTQRWIDLNGEGLSGILTEDQGGWWYKPNLGGGRLGPITSAQLQPSMANLRGGRQELLGLDHSGQPQLVAFAGPQPGVFERTYGGRWTEFVPFPSLPKIEWTNRTSGLLISMGMAVPMC